MRTLLLVGLALVGSHAVPRPPAQATPAHFRMVISPDGDGYAATCSTGCHWHALNFSCSGDCQVVIDNGGVFINSTTRTEVPTFAFKFRPVEKGWQLESLAGTGWQTLGWRCGMLGACSAEVDETGVRGPWI